VVWHLKQSYYWPQVAAAVGSSSTIRGYCYASERASGVDDGGPRRELRVAASVRLLNGLTRMHIARLFPAKYGRMGGLTWLWRGKMLSAYYDSAAASRDPGHVSSSVSHVSTV